MEHLISVRPVACLSALVALLLSGFWFLSCSPKDTPDISLTSEQKTAILLAKSLDATGSLLSSSELNDAFFTNFGIPRELRSAFIALYERLRSELGQVREEFNELQSVRFFLLNRYSTHSGDSLGDFNTLKYLSTAGNPLFMAFALRAEGLPDWTNIGSPSYIKTLCRSFHVSETNVIEGIWLCLRNDDLLVNEAVALMIDKNLRDSRCGEPDFLFRNVIIPYLTYISKGKPLAASIERNVFKQYEIVFGTHRKKNELRDFVVAFRGYCAGAAMNVRYRNELNAALARHRYRVIVQEKACVGYSILDYRIIIRKAGVNDVVFLKKISVSLSLALLGSSISMERDVTINFDDITDYADDICDALDTKSALCPLTPLAAPFWSDLQTGFDLDSANAVSATLLRREFNGRSLHAIVNGLIRKIAVHEAKHKWDESIHADKEWYNVDCETSALLADAIFGGVPFFSLLSFIHKYQDYYESIRNESIREKLRPILREAWKTAREAACGEIDSTEITTRLKKIYRSYEPIDGGALPDLELFRRDIVEPCFGKLPEFDLPLIN